MGSEARKERKQTHGGTLLSCSQLHKKAQLVTQPRHASREATRNWNTLKECVGKEGQVSTDGFPFPVFSWSGFAPWSLNAPECAAWPLWTGAGEARSDRVWTLKPRASSESRN